MNVDAHGLRDRYRVPLRVVLLMMVTGAVVVACDPDRDDEGDDARPRSLIVGGVPAPALTLHDGSPVTDYLRYGDALTFAVDSPGSVRISRVVNGTPSVLRVRSAMGLPRTADTAYLTGRIIARWETYRGPSRFGAPVGVSYLWVKRSAAGVYSGTLFSISYLTGDTSRTMVRQLHLPRAGTPPSPTPQSFLEDCSDVEEVGDTTQVCCACSGGRNCSFSQMVPQG